MQNSDQILIGLTPTGEAVSLKAAMANRHGLVAGATGTGKTATLQRLAEQFSALGVPVFTADVKGDLAGLAVAGSPSGKVAERIARLKITHTPAGNPVVLWDLLGKQGHPLRTTISELGPVLLGRVLDLNQIQQGVLQIAFSVADDEGLLLLDMKDLRSMLQWLGENAEKVQSNYGNVSGSSIGAIQRALLTLEEAGGLSFFGEPALKLQHLMQRDFSGRGLVSILDARSLLSTPRLYATFLLWLLSELFETLPEVGDQPLPSMVFFFDEAHLLFDNAPRPLLEKIEQIVRLIRSKGVGVFFVTQHPTDIPDAVAGQLGTKIQHALRAFTERDRKALRASAQTFRPNPNVDTEEALQSLEVGEALVSVLGESGAPTPVERTFIIPPASRLGPLSDEERQSIRQRSPLHGVYETPLDRESAHEVLRARSAAAAESAAASAAGQARSSSPRARAGFLETFVTSTVRTVGSHLGKQIVRGILGSLRRGR